MSYHRRCRAQLLCVVLRCRSCRPACACPPRPKTAVQAGCHLLVCETFCSSGLNSSSTKRMHRQRSSSSLAGLGSDLALDGSFVRARDECRSPEWRAEVCCCFCRACFSMQTPECPGRPENVHITPRVSLAQRQHCQGRTQSRSCHSPQKVQNRRISRTMSRVRQIWVDELGSVVPLQHHLAYSTCCRLLARCGEDER